MSLESPAEKPLISLTMIAKDEEALIGRALASVRPHVDQMVVVDTGSRDRTREIAREQGAEVYDHPWQNDFSLHRNQALEHARGQWALILDADEELEPQGADNLRRLAAEAQVNCYTFTVHNLAPGGAVAVTQGPRLFRRMPGAGYHRAVHNQLTVPGAWAVAPVRVIHHGYALDAAGMAARHQRRLEMIGQWVAREPGNWEAHYYLAQTLVSQPDRADQAAGEAIRALRLAQESQADLPAFSRVFLPLVQALDQAGRCPELLQASRDWAMLEPYHPDPELYWARALYYLDRLDQVGAHIGRMLELHQAILTKGLPRPHLAVTTRCIMDTGLVIWAVAEAVLDRRDKAAEVFRALYGLPRGEAACREAVAECRRREAPAAAAWLTDLARADQPRWAWAAREA